MFAVCNVDVGFVSVDQEKAFDGVDHCHLFSAFRAFCFGDGFRTWVGLLYSDAQCMLKMGEGLSQPIPVQ